jgi:hypothetical protein
MYVACLYIDVKGKGKGFAIEHKTVEKTGLRMVINHGILFKHNEQVIIGSKTSEWRGKVVTIITYHEKSRRYGVKRGNDIRYFCVASLMKACPFGMKTMKSPYSTTSTTKEQPSMAKDPNASVIIEDAEYEDEASYDHVQEYDDTAKDSRANNVESSSKSPPFSNDGAGKNACGRRINYYYMSLKIHF